MITSTHEIKHTERLRDSLVYGSSLRGGATEQELKTGSTWAVANTNGTSQLDKVASGDVVLGDESGLLVGDLISTQVGMVVGLSVDKSDDRTIGTSTTKD